MSEIWSRTAIWLALIAAISTVSAADPNNRKLHRLGLISNQNELVNPVTPQPNVEKDDGYRMPSQNEILTTIAIVLGCIAAVLYLIFIFRDVLRPCIEATEKTLEFIVSTLIRPVNFLIHCLKEAIYPIKQCAFSSVESLDYSLHPWKRTTY